MADAKITVSAQDNASRVLSQVRGSLDQVQSVATRVGSVLGLVGIAGAGGLVAMAKSAIDGVDALNDLKDATGSSIENISALEDVAIRTGTSFDTVSTALVKFNGVLKEASPGSSTEAVLKAIGLSAKELKELDPAEALLQTAKALNSFADDGNKARITQELFGKSLKDVAPLLKDLAEKGKLAGKVTGLQADEAERLNKELANLQKNATDASRALVGPMVSALNETIDLFRLGAKEGKSFYATLRDEQLRLLGLKDGPQEYAARLIEVNKQLQGGETRLLVRSALLREQAELQKKLAQSPNFGADNQSTAEDYRLARRPSAPDVPSNPPAKGGSGKTQAQKDQEEFENLRIKMQRDMAMEAGDAVIAENAAYQKSLLERAEATEKFIGTLMREEVSQADSNEKMREAADEIGLTTAQVDALRLSRLDSNIALEEQNQLTRFELGVSADVLNFYQRKIDLLKEQRALTATTQVRQAAADTKKEQVQASKEFADTLHGDLKGAFSAAFRDTKDPMGAFGNALADVIYTRSATALAEALTNEALSSGSGGAGGIIASVASFFGFANGGIMSSGGALPLNAYAGGGIASSPQVALFGEGRMNEAYVPLPDGKSIPVSLQGGGGSSVTIHQPLTINAPNASAQTVAQIQSMMPGLIAANARVVEGVIKQAMRRGGGRLSV